MAHRKTGGKKRAHRTRKRVVASRELLVIDEKPIRKRAIQRCKYILRQFDSVLGELDRYESMDMPAYRRWIHRTFGAMLTEVRELDRELAHIEHLMSRIQTLRVFGGMSSHEAYKVATEVQEEPTEFDDEEFEEDWVADDEGQVDDEQAYADEESGEPDISDEELASILADIAGQDPAFVELDADSEAYRTLAALLRKALQTRGAEGMQAEAAFYEFYERIRHGEDPDEVSHHYRSETAQLKALYRSLAKTLHPDNRDEGGASENELWYRVQDAFARHDVAELQMLEAYYHVRNARRLDHLPVSQILAVHADYKEELGVLRRRHREVQKDTAWGFAALDDGEREELRRSHEQMLADELARMRSRKATLESFMAKHSRPPEPKPSKKKRWTPPEEQLSLFDSD